MRGGSWLLAASLLAGCGGPELRVDTTPPVLIPNGGSAQAGQVEGPTAIPITGDGAVQPAPVVEAPVAAPAAPPLTVMDQAAIEATKAADADDDDDAGPDADADEPSDDAVSDVEAPPSEPVAAAPLPATPTVAAPAVRPIRADGYAFTIPAVWENLDPTGLGSFLITSANRSMDPGDGFYTNVIVSAEPFPGDTPSYATLNVPSLVDAGAALRDAETVAPTKRDRGHVDVEAYWLNVTGVPYVTLQRYLTTGQVGFVVTCAAAASAFEEERATCLEILDSFRVE